MIGLLVVAACSGGGAVEAPVELPGAADKATFATVASLGSYQLTASVRREVGAPGAAPSVAQETIEVRWRDPDHWSYVHGRDGRIRSDVLVWDGVAFAGRGDGPRERRGDAEPYRVQLASVWNPWEWALESLAGQVAYDEGEVELVEGRRVRRHALALAPAGAGVKRGWSATGASGTVWIDEETAVRLKGQVNVDATSGARTQRIELLFSIDGIGVDPGLSPPGGDKP